MNFGKREKQLIVVLIGVIIIFGILWWGISTGIQNDIILTKQITIVGKICPISMVAGKIQDSENNIYFIPLSECNNYTVNSTRTIQYNHIKQLTIGNWSDFDRIIGDY